LNKEHKYLEGNHEKTISNYYHDDECLYG
jgi:hypothetical protein